MVSLGGPLSRRASSRSPVSPTACTCSVRDSVSGLYCSAITRSTAPDDGSISTMPPWMRRGELGEVVILLRSFLGSARPAGAANGSGLFVRPFVSSQIMGIAGRRARSGRGGPAQDRYGDTGLYRVVRTDI